MILKFNNYIREQIDESFDDVKEDLKKMIEKSLKTNDQKTIEEFISAYLRDNEKNKIEGLINDSDIYDFYLKYRNNVDNILSDKGFFEKRPSDSDSFSLYDYVVVGTNSAIIEILRSIIE